ARVPGPAADRAGTGPATPLPRLPLPDHGHGGRDPRLRPRRTRAGTPPHAEPPGEGTLPPLAGAHRASHRQLPPEQGAPDQAPAVIGAPSSAKGAPEGSPIGHPNLSRAPLIRLQPL